MSLLVITAEYLQAVAIEVSRVGHLNGKVYAEQSSLYYTNSKYSLLNQYTNLKNVFELMNISPERKLIVKYNNDDSKIGIIALYDIFKRLVV